MKLMLNRTEAEEGMFKKSTIYYLDVTLEVTQEEMALIKKHWWDSLSFCEGEFKTGAVIDWTVGNVVGKLQHWGFKSAEKLAYVEAQVIESAKKLKQQLAAASTYFRKLE